MARITTKDGTELYVKTWGEGRPVLLVHGWPLSADSWDDHALVLANAGFKAIAYDRRGFGRSSQPWTGYEYDTFADDLAEVIKATNATNAALFGFSMGGGEVARYMSRYDGKGVTQAGLISSILPYMLKTDTNPNGVPQETFDKMTEGMLEDRAKFFTGFFKDFYGVSLLNKDVSNELLHSSWATAMQAGLHPTLEAAKAFSTTDFRDELNSFKGVPTLIVHGVKDKTVPIDTSARPASKSIRNAQLVEIDDGAHGLLATHKDKISELLLGFLTK